jgi:hypothetical protein
MARTFLYVWEKLGTDPDVFWRLCLTQPQITQVWADRGYAGDRSPRLLKGDAIQAYSARTAVVAAGRREGRFWYHGRCRQRSCPLRE